MADTYGNGLIVYRNGKLQRFESLTFEPSESGRDFVLDDAKADFSDDGILGLSLSPMLFRGEPRFLYFRPLSSFGLFAINTKDLKDQRPGNNVTIFGKSDLLGSQAVGQVFSEEGILFLGLFNETAITCYNRYNELTRNNFVS